MMPRYKQNREAFLISQLYCEVRKLDDQPTLTLPISSTSPSMNATLNNRFWINVIRIVKHGYRNMGGFLGGLFGELDEVGVKLQKKHIRQ